MRQLIGLLLGWVVWPQVTHALLSLIVELPTIALPATLPVARYVHLYDDELVPKLLLLNGVGWC